VPQEDRRKERLDRGVKARTEGIYAISAPRDIAYLLIPRLVLILGLLILPLVMQNIYWQKVLCIICVFALLSISFNFLTHFVGIVNLGNALFVGVGGYTSAVLHSSFKLSPVLSIIAGTFGGALISTILLLPCLPARGIYFAIASLMYPLIFPRIIEALNIFGGTDGIIGVATFPNIWVDQYLIIVVLLVTLFVLRRLVNEDFGLILRGIKDNDQAIRASGIGVTWYKTQGVFIASAIGCFTGAYLVHLYGWAGISLFGLDFSIFPIAVSVVGGSGTLVGSVVGSLILVPMSEMLRAFGTLRIMIYCLILVGFITLKPEGLMRYFTRKYEQFEHWKRV